MYHTDADANTTGAAGPGRGSVWELPVVSVKFSVNLKLI